MSRLKVSHRPTLAQCIICFLVLCALPAQSARTSSQKHSSSLSSQKSLTTTTTESPSSRENGADYYNGEDVAATGEGNSSREDYSSPDEPSTSYQPGQAGQPDPFEHIELLLPNKSSSGKSLQQSLKPLSDDVTSEPTLDADTENLPEISEDDFCAENFVDAAYYNGYDLILTRGDRLYYYFKDEHRLSPPYKQSKFTQGKSECSIIYSFLFCFQYTQPL